MCLILLLLQAAPSRCFGYCSPADPGGYTTAHLGGPWTLIQGKQSQDVSAMIVRRTVHNSVTRYWPIPARPGWQSARRKIEPQPKQGCNYTCFSGVDNN